MRARIELKATTKKKLQERQYKWKLRSINETIEQLLKETK